MTTVSVTDRSKDLISLNLLQPPDKALWKRLLVEKKNG